MKTFSLFKLLKQLTLVMKLDLYKYPSVFTLLERETYKWFDGFDHVQSIYIDEYNKIERRILEYFLKKKVLFWNDKLDIKNLTKKYKLPNIYFPNISNFKVILGPLSWIFALFGYSKRISNIYLFRNYKNKKVNRKLFFLYLSLYYLKSHSRYKSYWKVVQIILKDKDYMLAVFNKTHPCWYKSWDLKVVIRLLEEIRLIVKCSDQNMIINFKRVYILKGNGKYRPLGVPSLAYRVYLSMLNNLISFVRVDNKIVENQHGYLPQKSILTAWKSIYLNLGNFRFVYEFDLKGFFDNVSHSLIDNILESEYKCPFDFRKRILTMNQSLVLLNSKDLLFEPDRFPLLHGSSVPNPNVFYSSDSEYVVSRYWTKKLQDNKVDSPIIPNTQVLEYPSLDELEDLFSPDGADTVNLDKKFIDQPVYEVDFDDREIPIRKDKGVPQGGACSPTLATLCLDLLFKEVNSDKSVKLIMYADDGLIFANDLKSIYTIEAKLNEIVTVSKEKSGFVKFKGSYCKNLKFCGLIFNASQSILSSCTRSGTILEFGPIFQYLTYLWQNTHASYKNIVDLKEFSVVEFLFNSLSSFTTLSPFEKIKLFFNPSLGGYLLNCLYLGSFSFQIREKNNFFEGHKFSWLNRRWGLVFKSLINENRNFILSLIDFEISWIIYNIVSRKYSTSIFRFVNKNSLILNLLDYLSTLNSSKIQNISLSVVPYEVNTESQNYYLNCDSVLTRKLLCDLSNLLKLKNDYLQNLTSNLMINSFISKSFQLSRFNCSSFAIYDLRKILCNKNLIENKQLIKYCFPSFKGPKNQVTLVLKESKNLRKLRLSLYPNSLFQGLIK